MHILVITVIEYLNEDGNKCSKTLFELRITYIMLNGGMPIETIDLTRGLDYDKIPGWARGPPY